MYNIRLHGRRLLRLVLILTIAFPLYTTPSAQAWQLTSGTPISVGDVHIVAVMTEFQEDDNRFTTGNGKFNPDFLQRFEVTLDPLPHDRQYFESHLEFASNYFRTVSGNQLNITWEVLPEIVTLPHEMAAYSPLGQEGDENYKLADLANDTWTIVRQNGLLSDRNFDPDRTMFIIFHAGAGRDLELTGTTLTKTPQDIPSVYLSKNSLQRLLQQPDFQGFPISESGRVTNTAILPETQSRPGEDVLGNEFVLELSINGILTAQIGSFLGLPDLFNTENGRSGIGRFGLMDGAGFFSYFGLFPPEPSAWEKVALGWIQPIDITDMVNEPATFDIPAAALHQPGSILKYRFTSEEYYLIENRHRDINNTGVTLTIRQPDGTITNVNLNNSERRFDPFDFSKIDEVLPPGVLINVSNFDWSLPGGLDPGPDRQYDTPDDRILNGGILIWHIDESVIKSKFESNTINNDPDRRGIRLVEADAAQDIGRPSAGVTGYDQGNPFDFWWSGNNFTVITATGQRIILYQNRLGDDTIPNNRTNSGARTFFELYDFSDTAPVASFSIRRTELDDIRKLPDIQLPLSDYSQPAANQTQYSLSVNVFVQPDNDTLLIVPTPSTLTAFSTSYNQVASRFESNRPDIRWTQPLITSNGLLVWSPIVPYGSQPPSQIHSKLVDLTSIQPETPHLIYDVLDVFTRGVPSAIGNMIRFDRSRYFISDLTNPVDVQSSPQESVFAANSNNGSVYIQNRSLISQDATIATFTEQVYQSPRLDLSSAHGPAGQSVISIWSSESIFTYAGTTNNTQTYPVLSPGSFSWPVLTDLNADGVTDYLYINYTENTIEAVNLYGAQLNQFPMIPPDGMQLRGVPLFLPSTDANAASIIVMADDGNSINLLVYDLDDTRKPAHTLLAGNSLNDSNMLIHPVVRDGILYAVSRDGQLQRWELKWRSDKPNAYLYGHPFTNKQFNTSSVVGDSPMSDLLIAHETYNWPNPVRDETRIRVLTSKPADVSITIINYSGQKIREITGTSPGSLPIEFEVDTTMLSNGVYFARVSAKHENKTEHKVITMVVIR